MGKMYRKVLIFGGTTEGRAVAERLLAEGVPCTVSVATRYGAEILRTDPRLEIHTGRMDSGEMEQFMRGEDFCCVIDATHPYAQIVSREIRRACVRTGLPCLRFLRDTADAGTLNGKTCDGNGKDAGDEKSEKDGNCGTGKWKETGGGNKTCDGNGKDAEDGMGKENENREKCKKNEICGTGAGPGAENGGRCVYVRDAEEAGKYLAAQPGRILTTIGSRDLIRFVGALGDPARVTARVLPAPESLRICAGAGLSGKQIFAGQGPFDTEMNCALIRHAGASWLLTKETGAAGGYPEKVEAARRCGTGLIVIKTPSDRPAAGEKKPESPEYFENTGEIAAAAIRHAAGKGRQEGPPGALAETLRETLPETLRETLPETMPEGAAADLPPKSSQAWSKKRPEESPGKPPGALPEKPEEESPQGSSGKTLYLVGAGVGAPEAMTGAARQAFAEAELIFGAESVLDGLRRTGGISAGKACLPIYDSREILQYLGSHPDIRCAAAAYSGDSGFYSGATAMLETLKKEAGAGTGQAASWKRAADAPKSRDWERALDAFKAQDGERSSDVQPEGPVGQAMALCGWDVRVLPGISCASWFAARAGIPWQGWKFLSSHGRFCNVVGQVRRNHRCFLLLSGAEDLRGTGKLLWEAQKRGELGPLRLITGYELSRPGEEIREHWNAAELMEIRREGLYVLFIENEIFPMTPVLPGLPDGAFCRGRAPMTSEEIRVLSLSRLGLPARPVLWDVGAGTGSISVEAALACPEGRVWAVEYKKEALSLLQKNREIFCLQNMEIVEGRAPEVLRDLPAPTHVFIGGSGGKIEEILRQAFYKNPQARVVANCITSETLAALQKALVRLRIEDADCIQVSVNREKKLGACHYLQASNPVFIISFRGRPTRGFPGEFRAAQDDGPEEGA